MTQLPFRYCPQCAAELAPIVELEDSGHKERLRCAACGFTHWNNPTPVLAAVIESLGGTMEKVIISDLQESTFFARLYIRRGGEVIDIDSRPSDAIALGVATDVPIFVNEEVLAAVKRADERESQK